MQEEGISAHPHTAKAQDAPRSTFLTGYRLLRAGAEAQVQASKKTRLCPPVLSSGFFNMLLYVSCEGRCHGACGGMCATGIAHKTKGKLAV